MDARTLSVRNRGPLPPGTVPRLKLQLRLQQYRHRLGLSWRPRCSCGANWRTNPGPMLHNHIWNRIAVSKEELLCDNCTRRRLGHPPTRWELRPCPFNTDHAHYPRGPYVMWRHPWGRFPRWVTLTIG